MNFGPTELILILIVGACPIGLFTAWPSAKMSAVGPSFWGYYNNCLRNNRPHSWYNTVRPKRRP